MTESIILKEIEKVSQITQAVVNEPIKILNNLTNPIHNLLEKVIDLSKLWEIKDLLPEDLIIKNKDEYLVMQNYRQLIKTQNEFVTKNFTDNFVIQQNALFEARNEGKSSTKKKKFWK